LTQNGNRGQHKGKTKEFDQRSDQRFQKSAAARRFRTVSGREALRKPEPDSNREMQRMSRNIDFSL
jgi:hypothetical protein